MGKSGSLEGWELLWSPLGVNTWKRRKAKDTNAAPRKAIREENKMVASPSISGQEANTEAPRPSSSVSCHSGAGPNGTVVPPLLLGGFISDKSL